MQEEESKLVNQMKTQFKMQQVKNYGIGENKSASTLYHPTPVISFSKAERFNYKSFNELLSDKQQDLEIPNTLAHRATSLGYGYKDTLDRCIQAKKDNPGPDKYSRYQQFDKQGKTFGVSYEAYRKVHIPGMILNGMYENLNPGPGKYEVSQNVGDEKKKYSILARNIPDLTKKEVRPCPGTYEAQDTILQNTRFRGVGIGYGKKRVNIKDDPFPGPGTYESKSVFDKYGSRPFRHDIYQNNISMQLERQ